MRCDHARSINRGQEGIQEGYGSYFVNPVYVFRGSDERGDYLRKKFRQKLVSRERARRSPRES